MGLKKTLKKAKKAAKKAVKAVDKTVAIVGKVNNQLIKAVPFLPPPADIALQKVTTYTGAGIDVYGKGRAYSDKMGKMFKGDKKLTQAENAIASVQSYTSNKTKVFSESKVSGGGLIDDLIKLLFG